MAPAAPSTKASGQTGPEQVVYVSVPIFDAHDQIVDLRIADVDDEHRADSDAYRAAVGRLGSALFTDPAKMILAASVAWKQGNAEPFTTQRRYDEGIGSGLADCQVTTMRLGDRILQICQDLTSPHVLAPSDTLLRSVIESADLAVTLFKPLLDADGHVIDVEVLWHNDAAGQIWGPTLMRIGQRHSDLDGDDPTLVELADDAWHDGTVSRLRRLPELGRGELTTISQSIQRVGDHLVEVAIDLTDQAETNQALRHLETRFGKTLDAVTDAIVVVQPSYDDDGRFDDGIITYANDAVLRLFGPLINASRSEQQTGDDDQLTLASLGFRTGDLAFEGVAAAATGQRIDRLFGASTETNSTRLAHLALAHATFTPMANEVLVVIRDLSQLHHARGQLERAIALDELVVDALSEPAVIFQDGDDGRPTIIAANEAARTWLPHPPPLSIDELPFRAAAPVMERGVRDAIDRATPSRDTHIVQEGPGVPNDDVVAVRFVHSPMAGFRSLMVVHDVSSEVNEGRRYRRQSRQDPETGLLNSTGFVEDLDERLADGSIAAITALRLDQFERVEAMLGPAASSTILLSIIDRVEALAPADTIIGRLRFMTFAFALPAGLSRDDTAAFARAITATVDQPFVVDGKPVHIGGHVGILHLADVADSRVGDDIAGDALHLVQYARLAANKAQQLHVPHIVWDLELEQDQPRRIELLGQLEQAMHDRELHMVFQPHVAPDGSFLGAEALVRWTHPTYGLLSPAEFIDLVETSTLILPFTAYVLREALVNYSASGLPGPCSVNVPPALLSDPGFIPTVRQVLTDTGTEPSRLCIEVTERGLMRVAEHVSRATAQLHELGCHVAMDDFGSGSTSLAHLARLGFDSLKVDRQIIDGIDADPINQAVLEGIVRIAGAAGLLVIAEGVETDAERSVAIELGCHGLQGYLLDRPGPIDGWIANYR